MEARALPPSENLAPLVKEFWHVRFGKNEDVSHSDIIVPTGYMNIVFNFGRDYHFVNRMGESEKLPPVLVTGQLDRMFQILYGERTEQFGIVLKPLGFHLLFQRPGVLYAGMLIDGSHPPWNLAALNSQLGKSTGFEESVKLTEDFINGHIVLSDSPEKIGAILDEIESLGGNASVKEFADRNGLSLSSFERYFKKMIGMPPKAYLNIIRFREAMEIMDESDRILDHFYDQSHFIKACRKYTGKTPSELLRRNEEITLDYMLNRR